MVTKKKKKTDPKPTSSRKKPVDQGKKATKAKKDKYIPAIGRRKTATAQVRITPAKAMKIVINGQDIADYFKVAEFQKNVEAPFKKVEVSDFEVSVLVKGGGMSAQSEAIRHGISRALIKYNEDLRGDLKKIGFLKRDPRKKERKKFGLKKARKAPQWSKR